MHCIPWLQDTFLPSLANTRLLWLPLKLCCGFPLLVRQPHCSRRSTVQQKALTFINFISTSSSFSPQLHRKTFNLDLSYLLFM